VISESKANSPDLVAVRILAEYLKAPSEDSKAVTKAQELAKKEGDNLTVQLLCGTVLANAGLVEEALALLAKHQGSLDAYVQSDLRGAYND
jgi:coatomer protein complex subunit epsilon